MRPVAVNEKKARLRPVAPMEIVNLDAADIDKAAFRLNRNGAGEPCRGSRDGRPFLIARSEIETAFRCAHFAGRSPSALKTPVPVMMVRSPHQMRPFTV